MFIAFKAIAFALVFKSTLWFHFTDYVLHMYVPCDLHSMEFSINLVRKLNIYLELYAQLTFLYTGCKKRSSANWKLIQKNKSEKQMIWNKFQYFGCNWVHFYWLLTNRFFLILCNHSLNVTGNKFVCFEGFNLIFQHFF